MRSGFISEWNDERGYGFIIPSPESPKVFFHISDYMGIRSRPTMGQAVSFDIAAGERGDKAINVLPVSTRKHLKLNPALLLSLVWTAVFFAATTVLVITQSTPAFVPVLYVTASAITFAVYGADKAYAKAGDWRVPEQTLHLLSLCGGWPGALIAQQYFRHKNRKVTFQIFFWMTTVLNCIALGMLAIYGMDQVVSSLKQLAAQ